jgi:hypothetical protein
MFWQIPVTKLVSCVVVVEAETAIEARDRYDREEIVEARDEETVDVLDIGEPAICR